jgi:hypothetical protein
MISRLWNQWVSFWNRKENGTAMAGVRISIGFTLLYTFGWPWLAGASDAIWLDSDFGGIRNYHHEPWLFKLLGGASPQALYSILSTGLLSALCLILGIFPRIAALLGMIVINNIAWHNILAGGGHDDLIENILWILVFTDSATTYSLSAKIKTGNWRTDREISTWPRYLLLIQLITMYTSTGWQKLSSHWVPFGDMDALWYILQQPTWARIDMQWFAPYAWTTQCAAFFVWFFEAFAPLIFLLLYFENTPEKGGKLRTLANRVPWRRLFCIFGISMHCVISLGMVIGPFSFASLAIYFAFIPPKKK